MTRRGAGKSSRGQGGMSSVHGRWAASFGHWSGDDAGQSSLVRPSREWRAAPGTDEWSSDARWMAPLYGSRCALACRSGGAGLRSSRAWPVDPSRAAGPCPARAMCGRRQEHAIHALALWTLSWSSGAGAIGVALPFDGGGSVLRDIGGFANISALSGACDHSLGIECLKNNLDADNSLADPAGGPLFANILEMCLECLRCASFVWSM